MSIFTPFFSYLLRALHIKLEKERIFFVTRNIKIYCLNVFPEAEPGHGEGWEDNEEGGEPKIPVMIDSMVHRQVVEVVCHDTVHYKIHYIRY